MNSRLLLASICCAALGLAACGGGTGGGAPQAELDRVAAERDEARGERDEARGERDAAQSERDAARTALAEARTALIDAQAALAQGAAGDPAARMRLGETLTEISGELEDAAMALPPVDGETEARKATRIALEATKTAIDRLVEAVNEAGAAVAAGASAPVAADAHTALDLAQTAVMNALGAVATAQGLLEDMPDAEASGALTQAQNALLAAQLSLTPVLRRELDAAETDVTRLTGDVAAKDAELRTARARATELEGQLAAARGRATELEGQLKTATDGAAALRTQLAAANARADELKGQLAAANARVATLEREKAALEREKAALDAQLDIATLLFGENVDRPAARPVGARVERTRRVPVGADGVEIVIHEGYDARAGTGWGEHIKYTATAGADPYTPREAPPAVVHAEDSPSILGAGNPATTHFPGRGTVFRGELRAPQARADQAYVDANGGTLGDYIRASAVGGYAAKERLRIQGRRTDDPSAPSVAGAAEDGLIRAADDADSTWKSSDAIPQMSFRYYDDERGWTMLFGGTGDGALIFGDLEAFAAKGPVGSDLEHDNKVTDDLEISFGAPSPDPYGERGYRWLMDVPSPKRDLVRDDDGDPVTVPIAAGATVPEGHYKWMDADGTNQLTNGDGVPLYVRLRDDPIAGVHGGGAYEAFLSNHAGPDAGTDGIAGTADDEQLYLQYAAYGLFRFLGYDARDLWASRLQTFHYGFDAFDGDPATPDIPADTADPIAATFSGRTAGWILLPANNTEEVHTTHGFNGLPHCGDAGNANCPSNWIGDMVRLRGNVALTACIGGNGTCAFGAGADDDVEANKVSGAISGLEYATVAGAWTNRETAVIDRGHRTVHGTINLAGDIGSGGRYNGDATPETEGEPQTNGGGDFPMSYTWGAGEFEGAFYGPQDALETAGTWWTPAAPHIPQYAGMIGSFGAVCTDCAE